MKIKKQNLAWNIVILKLCRFGKACKRNLIDRNRNSETHWEPTQRYQRELWISLIEGKNDSVSGKVAKL